MEDVSQAIHTTIDTMNPAKNTIHEFLPTALEWLRDSVNSAHFGHEITPFVMGTCRYGHTVRRWKTLGEELTSHMID